MMTRTQLVLVLLSMVSCLSMNSQTQKSYLPQFEQEDQYQRNISTYTLIDSAVREICTKALLNSQSKPLKFTIKISENGTVEDVIYYYGINELTEKAITVYCKALGNFIPAKRGDLNTSDYYYFNIFGESCRYGNGRDRLSISELMASGHYWNHNSQPTELMLVEEAESIAYEREYDEFVVDDYDMVEVPPQEYEIAPPPPPEPVIIEIVEDNDEIIELSLDMEIDEDVEIEDYNFDYEEVDTYQDEQVFMRAERMRVFKDECETSADAEAQARCTEKAIISFLQNNLEYPEIARENGFQGRVFVSFVVNKDGTVSDIKVLRGTEASLNKAAVDVVNKLPVFIPAKQRGKPVRLKYTVPISFKITK